MVGQWDPLKMQVSILKISGIGSPLPWLGPRELLQNVWIHIFCLKIFRRRVGFRSPPTIVWRFPFRHGGTPRNIIHFERWCFRLQTIQLLGGYPHFFGNPHIPTKMISHSCPRNIPQRFLGSGGLNPLWICGPDPLWIDAGQLSQ